MENGRKVTVLLDGSHHAMRMVFACKSEETAEEGFQLFRYRFINGIFQYIQQFNADEFIIAMDSRENWRKEIFKYYKADRKFKRKTEDESEGWFTYQQYYEEFDRLANDIVKNLPIKVLKINFTEADDIIGILCNSDELGENVKIVVTNDGDYSQLLSNQLVRVFNPMTKQFMESSNPKQELLHKIIMGDKGDYVPSIQDRHIFKEEFLEYCVKEDIAKNRTNVVVKLESDENLKHEMELKFLGEYGIKASKVMRFSGKMAISLSQNKSELEKLLSEDKNLKKKFLRNNKLVNLTAQPDKIKKLVLDTYRDYKLTAGLKKLFEFFIVNSFNEFIEDNTKIGNFLEPLCDINTSKEGYSHDAIKQTRQVIGNT